MTRECKRRLAMVIAFVALVASATATVRSFRRWRTALVQAEWPRPVTDDVLADRIRSELGVLEHLLDTPRIHVLVERSVALLHGDVPSTVSEELLIARVRAVEGVRDVVSNLHVGLVTGDGRPSTDRGRPSTAARRLVDAARTAGGGDVTAESSTRAVLAAIASALPSHVVHQLQSHLPTDAASWLLPSRDAFGVTTVDELYAAVAADGALAPTHVPWVVASVLRELAALTPHDADAVAAHLAVPLAHLWADAVVATG